MRRARKKLFVSPTRESATSKFRGLSAARPLAPEVAKALAIEMGLPVKENEMLLVEVARGEEEEKRATTKGVLLHCSGLTYGLILGDLLETTFGVVVEECDELSVTLNGALPTAELNFTEPQVTTCVQKRWRQFENWLAAGAFQKLLPPSVRAAHVVAAFQVAKFQQLFFRSKVLTEKLGKESGV